MATPVREGKVLTGKRRHTTVIQYVVQMLNSLKMSPCWLTQWKVILVGIRASYAEGKIHSELIQIAYKNKTNQRATMNLERGNSL